MTNFGEDVSLQHGESVGNFVWQSRQPGKGASGQKGRPGTRGEGRSGALGLTQLFWAAWLLGRASLRPSC